jgi:PAS domain S-box-containing protein
MVIKEDVDKSPAERLAVSNRSFADVEAMYGGLIETLPAIVYVAEPFPPYKTIYVSRWIESLGYTLAEWLSRPDIWVSIIHKEDREWVLRQTEEAMSQRRENDYEYRVIAKDGSTHWLHDRGRFVMDEMNEPICWQGVLLDVTKRKQAEAEREASIKQLQQALAEIKTLSGLLPICSYCKSVRTDKNYWQAIDQYITQHSDTQFSHSICPGCYAKFVLPDLAKARERNQEI